MNPYASYLGSRDPFEVITKTAYTLEHLYEAIGHAAAQAAPAPGKWSAREILCHLADTEIVFAFRLRQALAEEHHVVQPFDQERWAARYVRCSAKAALTTFAAVRRWNLLLIDTITEDEHRKIVMHPERGEMTIRTVVETMAGHDLNHLQQLEQLIARA